MDPVCDNSSNKPGRQQLRLHRVQLVQEAGPPRGRGLQHAPDVGHLVQAHLGNQREQSARATPRNIRDGYIGTGILCSVERSHTKKLLKLLEILHMKESFKKMIERDPR